MNSNDSQNPVQPTLVSASDPVAAIPISSAPTVIIQHHDRGIVWRILALLGWGGFCLVAIVAVAQYLAYEDYFDTSGGITEKFHSGKKFGGQKVAIVSIEGMIADEEGYVKAQIDQIRADQQVKAIVVRVNSPGGTVTGSDYILHHLNKLREDRKLPLVVSMGGLAASGGYYVSMAVGDQEQSIFAEPTTTTGSIGVMLPHYDVSGLLARFDVEDDTLVSHPRKLMGSMTRPMPEEHRMLLQNYINESFGRFKEIVQSGRPKLRQNPEALDQIATGEIFTANQALKHGLIDQIGFVEDAIDRAIALANLDKENVRVIRFERPVSLFSIAGLAQAPPGRRGFAGWSNPLDAAVPRAYYLASAWPALWSTY